MPQLNEVSETALITLRSRVIESQKPDPVFKDPIGAELFTALTEALSEDVRERIMNRRLSPVLTLHIALRARKYDHLCLEFLEDNPDGLIVNLGCGFDTRFWRLGIPERNYMELDLPALTENKQMILGERITYQMIGASVLDEEWIDRVMEIRADRVLFIAEGLFMYLVADEVIRTLKDLAGKFRDSRLVMEVVARKYTEGWRKKMVERKMRRGAGSTAGDFYQFGISELSDLETFHPGFSVRGVWSYFEDPDIRPRILRLFRYLKSISRTQYTVVADIM